VCVYVCMYVCVCVYRTLEFVFARFCVCVCMYVCKYVCVCRKLEFFSRDSVYVCMCVCMYVCGDCVCVCRMYVCICDTATPTGFSSKLVPKAVENR
jgi:hypothetical protein